ncbi:unnamed protein product [Urochloa humidicola]
MATASSTAVAGDDGDVSIVSADTATGWHEFNVQGYSHYKGLGNGRAVRSGRFIVGGHRWRIVYFPNGNGKENADWIYFGLRLEHPRPDADVIKARFTLSLLDKDGDPIPSYRTVFPAYIFSTKILSFGKNRFIKREDLDSLHLTEDCFCIRCDVTVVEDVPQESVVPLPDLHSHVGSLLDGELGGDVTFEVDGEELVAHKYMLAARSPVFKAQFFGCPMKEKAAARVRIVDVEARVFRAMLHFIYTDSLPQIAGGDKIIVAQHLLVAADRYCIERLKLICESMLCTFINKRIAATTLVLAEQHGCHRLKEVCLRFLKSNENFKALANDDYKLLKRSCPSVLDELRSVP